MKQLYTDQPVCINGVNAMMDCRRVHGRVEVRYHTHDFDTGYAERWIAACRFSDRFTPRANCVVVN